MNSRRAKTNTKDDKPQMNQLLDESYEKNIQKNKAVKISQLQLNLYFYIFKTEVVTNRPRDTLLVIEPSKINMKIIQ